MIILSVQHVAKAFGGTEVLKDVSLTVQKRERIGLVGANGCGKSTLLRILAGEWQADGGTVSVQKGLEIGYLAQQAPVIRGQTVYGVVDAVFEPVRDMEGRLRLLEQEMAEASDAETLNLTDETTHGLKETHSGMDSVTYGGKTTNSGTRSDSDSVTYGRKDTRNETITEHG